jgi:hypothetical protein
MLQVSAYSFVAIYQSDHNPKVSPVYKDPCNDIGQSKLISYRGNPNLITPTKSLLPFKVMLLRVLEIRMWTFLGGHYSVCQCPLLMLATLYFGDYICKFQDINKNRK